MDVREIRKKEKVRLNTVLVDVEAVPEPTWVGDLETFVQEILLTLERDEWEVSIVLCNDDVIAGINKEFRDKDGPTDVLSFPQIETVDDIPASGPFVAGDIVVSLDSVRSNAAYFSVDPEEEFKRVVVHGLLHLSGFDHETNEASEPMLQFQEKILSEYSGKARFSL